jgi:hypothetical protein
MREREKERKKKKKEMKKGPRANYRTPTAFVSASPTALSVLGTDKVQMVARGRMGRVR